MSFASRQDAGKKLGRFLLEKSVRPEVVLGLLRGGVIVAAEIAKVLQRPLGVIVVRKIGHPRFREFALGALAESGVVVLDEAAVRDSDADRVALDSVIAEEMDRLAEYQRKFELERKVSSNGKSVILVDDGLATGATMEAAVESARRQGASHVTVAVPIASSSGFERLQRVCDDVIAFKLDPAFEAVGQYYASFPQTDDREVIEVLRNSGASFLPEP